MKENNRESFLPNGAPADFYGEVVPLVDDTIESDGLPKDFAKMIDLHMLSAGHDLKKSKLYLKDHIFNLDEILKFPMYPLNELIEKNRNSFRLKDHISLQHKDSESGGVYIFWWVGSKEKLFSSNRNFTYSGIKGNLTNIELELDWFPKEISKSFPLYIGKTAKSFRSRISKHLLIKNPNRKIILEGKDLTKKYNSTSQLRNGIEKLFRVEKNILDLISRNIAVSLIPLTGDDNFHNRFYLENYLIGKLKPWFNLDIER